MEKMDMRKWMFLFLSIVLVLPLTSCRDEDPTELEIILEWIWEGMNEIYYWNEEIDPSLYPTDETQPADFFYSLLQPEDRFSWIVDDYIELQNSFAGIEVTNGISPYFIRLYNSDDVVVLVEYVSRDSPADSAGIERGDIITDVNGQGMNINNYADLFFSETVTLEFAVLIDNSLYRDDREVTLTAREIDNNPVQYAEVIEYENTKIGYLVYTQFTEGKSDKWLTELDNALIDFQSAGIDELVIDLRYNGGGSIYMAARLASSIAPSTLGGADIFVNLQWNDLYQDFIEREEGEDSPFLVNYFEENTSAELNLNEVYFLTARRTASASELTIIGLEPYMDEVTVIGDTTYGKPFGSVTVEDFEKPPRHNWAMQPIVFKYANALGFSDFASGLVPDIHMYDNLFEAKPFGDITDPMLAKALEQITGVSPIVTKSLQVPPAFRGLKDPRHERRNRAYINQKLPDVQKFNY